MSSFTLFYSSLFARLFDSTLHSNNIKDSFLYLFTHTHTHTHTHTRTFNYLLKSSLHSLPTLSLSLSLSIRLDLTVDTRGHSLYIRVQCTSSQTHFVRRPICMRCSPSPRRSRPRFPLPGISAIKYPKLV